MRVSNRRCAVAGEHSQKQNMYLRRLLVPICTYFVVVFTSLSSIYTYRCIFPFLFTTKKVRTPSGHAASSRSRSTCCDSTGIVLKAIPLTYSVTWLYPRGLLPSKRTKYSVLCELKRVRPRNYLRGIHPSPLTGPLAAAMINVK